MEIAQLVGASLSASPQRLSLVLGDPLAVSGTAYKVLRSQEPGRFVPCVRSRLNGRERLTYLTRHYTVLEGYAACLSPDAAMRLLATAVDSLMVLGDNGFLSMRDVAFSRDMLFVDQRSQRLLLVYLPLARSTSDGDLETARQAFRTSASVLDGLCGSASPLLGFESSPAYRDGDLAALSSLLWGSAAELETRGQAHFSRPAAGSAGDGSALREQSDDSPASSGWGVSFTRAWSFATTSSPSERFEVPANGGIVGKSPSRADVVVPLSPAISRSHCRVTPRGEHLEVEDLGSANGTFVNGERVAEGAPALLHEGDRLRLADVQFTVQRAEHDHV